MINDICFEERSWAWIPGYEGQYQISIDGIVRSIERIISVKRYNKFYNRIERGKILKYKQDSRGYYTVSLSKYNKCKTYRLHRLILKIYRPDLKEQKEINHINGNKKDNTIENLEWCNHSENIKHAWDNNLINHGLSTEEIQRIFDLKEAGYTIREIAPIFHRQAPYIVNILNGKNGRIWRIGK